MSQLITTPDVPGTKRGNRLDKFTRKRPVDEAGTITLRVNEVARARGCIIEKGPHKGMTNRAEVRRRTGVADDVLYYMLRHPEIIKMVHVWTLAKLCAGLECTPGDLLEFTPAGGGETPLSDQFKTLPEAPTP
jgi:DNA-binding Xre family transcriptional regulator